MTKTIFLLCALCVLHQGLAFYLPGLEPVNYCKNETDTCKSNITVYMHSLTPAKSIIPYEYHYFDFCNNDQSDSSEKTLGQVTFGDRLRPSPYKLQFLKEEKCAKVCKKSYSGDNEESEKKLDLLRTEIQLSYQHQWIVDNIPVTWCYLIKEYFQHCSIDFPMGCFTKEAWSTQDDSCSSIEPNIYNKSKTYYLFNHVDLVLTYQSGADEDWGTGMKENSGRIISINVTPRSIKHPSDTNLDCSSQTPLEIPSEKLRSNKKFDIIYTYSVRFVEKPKRDVKKFKNYQENVWDRIIKSITIIVSKFVYIF